MRCSIASGGLKSWGRAIHSLAAVGDQDIYFEFTTESLTLTTFDASVSVCASAKFERDFFMSYEIDIPPGNKLTCRVPSKCILKPFRSMRFLSKAISRVEIGFADNESDKLEINIKCHSGASVRYLILLRTEAEILQVECDMSLLKNCIQADSKLIVTSLGNFAHSKGVTELTLRVSENKILLKNSTTDLAKKESSIHTEVMLNKIEFNEFTIPLQSEITFQMREFKCFAGFAETMKLPISINFHGPTEPVVVTIKSDDHYEATLTLATILKDIENTNQSQTSTSSRLSTGSGTTASISHVTSEPRSPPPSLKLQRPSRPPSRRREPPQLKTVKPGPSSTASENPIPPPHESYMDDIDFDDMPASENSPSLISSPAFDFPEPLPAAAVDRTPVMNSRKPPKKTDGSITAMVASQRGPPHKKIKSLFPNLGNTFEPAVDIPGHDVVLCENSDEEFDEYDENY